MPNQKVIEGLVESVSGKKTIKVKVENLKRHPVYGKVVKVSSKYLVHDELEQGKVGDKVKIIASRPISKLKKWKLLLVVSATKGEQ